MKKTDIERLDDAVKNFDSAKLEIKVLTAKIINGIYEDASAQGKVLETERRIGIGHGTLLKYARGKINMPYPRLKEILKKLEEK